MNVTKRPRLAWFDANRVCAAIGVVLIHSTTDFSGGTYPDVAQIDRLLPVGLRSIAEFSGSEMFFFFSLFLMAMRVDRRMPSYGSAIWEQAQRLLVPFSVWTIFYAFFRLIKADAFNYSPYIVAQLVDWKAWLGYFFLGSAQYQLHFLPTLFALFLFFPVMKLALRYPILGIAVIPALGVMDHVQGYLWSLQLDPMLRDYLGRIVKIFGYVGYGLAAFAIYGLWRDGIPRGESKLIRIGAFYFAAMAYFATLPFYSVAFITGHYGVREGWALFGHLLMPLIMFALFMGGQHREWSGIWTKLAPFTFGIYLVHPIFVDLFDVTIFKLGLAQLMAPWMQVTFRFVVAMPLSLLAAMALARVQLLAWTIGLGPTPWEWAKVRPMIAQE